MIAVLPPHVIDQIAAGEVIERPASVVKELVDNAVDAGARTISIEAIAGGRGYIRVADDGAGMSPADAALAFERHATSKLRSVDELWGIASLGFRGEALPSIASVSRLVLTTRRERDLAGTRITFEAGRRLDLGEVGAPVGTTVEVSDLLFNLPARLKFLKGESTEAGHITDCVARIAMAYPHLHLRLRHNGRAALELPPDRDGLARAKALLGPRVAARLVAVSGEESGIRIAAYLGAPELAQTTARGVQLFVGRRPVRDRNLLHAVAMGYGELVPRGRYPVAVVLLDLPAGAVDVNVHPQKAEVRFADTAAVTAAVRHVVQAGVAAGPWRAESAATPVQMLASVAPPALPFDGHEATPLAQRYARELRARVAGAASAAQRSLALDGADSPRAYAYQLRRAAADAGAEPAPVGADRAAPARAPAAASARGGADGRAGGTAAVPRPEGFDPAAFAGYGEVAARFEDGDGAPPGKAAADPAPPRAYFASLRYLGQLDLTYLICEAPGELVLVDQHAAHERVELARLLARHTARAVATQKLLFPLTAEATPGQLAVLDRSAPALARIGYEVEPFGRGTLAIKAVPAGLRGSAGGGPAGAGGVDPAQLLRRLLDEWAAAEAAGEAPTEAERAHRALAHIACHSAVRAGDRLTPGEAEALLGALDGVDLVSSPLGQAGPHGRALLLRLPIAELGRRFGR